MRFINQFIYSIVFALLSIVVVDIDITRGLDDDSKKSANVYTIKKHE